MKGAKGKAPSFQFYVADWLSDEKLRPCCSSTRGIWIDLLCYMWKRDKSHSLTYSPASLSRMTGATLDEVNEFISDAFEHQFCNIDVEYFDDESDKLNIQNIASLTVTSRRFLRDNKQRKEWRNRYKKSQNKKKLTQDSRENKKSSNETPPVSSSSSSTSSSKNNKSDSIIESDFCSLEPARKICQACKKKAEVPADENKCPWCSENELVKV